MSASKSQEEGLSAQKLLNYSSRMDITETNQTTIGFQSKVDDLYSQVSVELEKFLSKSILFKDHSMFDVTK